MRQQYGKVIDLSNFGDDTANDEEEKHVVQSVAMGHNNDDPLNLSDNTRSMVKQPEHFEQLHTNNIDEMERLCKEIEGSVSGNGKTAAAASIGLTTISGGNLAKDGGMATSAIIKNNPVEEGEDEDEMEGNITRLVEKLE